MSVTVDGHEFTEIVDRIGEDTEFAATITAIPQYDGDELKWLGSLIFDDKRFNLRVKIDTANGQSDYYYHQWWFPRLESGGTYLMNLLIIWHGQLIDMFVRLSEKELDQ
jgi:hypothetical protein